MFGINKATLESKRTRIVPLITTMGNSIPCCNTVLPVPNSDIRIGYFWKLKKVRFFKLIRVLEEIVTCIEFPTTLHYTQITFLKPDP